MDGYIELDKLQVGTVYKLASRNLVVGVYRGDGYFIGIRNKFGNRFLDQEMEYTTNTHYGTARAKEALGTIAPEIPLSTSMGSECGKCGRPANFDMARPEKERWLHSDGSVMCQGVFAQGVGNKALFETLENFVREAPASSGSARGADDAPDGAEALKREGRSF